MNWTDIIISSDKKPELSKNARIVLKKRYLARDDKGNLTETPEELFKRVAKSVAFADFNYGKSVDEVNRSADDFYELMVGLRFLPNTPTLMNAGRPLGQLSSCFVLPVEDSMDKIFDSIKNMAMIHKSGGGTGFSFSRLRPKDDIVKSTAGVSSGPVSFMNIFNAATETIKQGGARRGANMAVLNVDHPDILDFINAKEDKKALTNFNISVALTDKFMKALERGEEYPLKNPNTGKTVKKLNTEDVFNLIIKKAWESGEPGIIFLDRINEDNPLKNITLIESTNPCGEQPLLPYESCNLGSINLNSVLKKRENAFSMDYDDLKKITQMAIHFLDNIIDINRYPLEKIKENTALNRKVGLGIMGFADILIRLNLPYDSDKAVDLAEKIMSTIQDESKRASENLARERGPFPNFQYSTYSESGRNPLRNSTTTTIAPTGTISIIANSSSGIEPIYALAYVRNVLDNNTLVEINPLFEDIAREKNFYSEKIMARISEHGRAAVIDEIPEEVKKIFVCAHDISPQWHIKIQAAFQKHVDNAVSKTVNFASNATEDDIKKAYTLAYRLGCKGVTVYRDGSRDCQVLEKKESRAKPKKRGRRPAGSKSACRLCGFTRCG